MDTEIREPILEYSRLWCTKDLVRNDEELKKEEEEWVRDRKKGSEGDWKQVQGRGGRQGGDIKVTSQAGRSLYNRHTQASPEGKRVTSFIQV